jgi:hypothetical protein
VAFHKRLASLLPLTILLHLFDLADDEVAFEAAETIDEEDAVEMIDLVLHRAGKELFSFNLEPLAFDVLRTYLDPGGALYLLANLGEAETALLFDLLTLTLDDLGVDEHDLLFRVLLEADVDDSEALRDTDLRCGKADALRGVHRLEHLIDEPLQLRVEDSDRLAGFGQNGVGPLYDFMYRSYYFAHLVRSNLLAIAIEVSL